MDVQKIGRFLRLLRKERALTQEQFGEIFGVAGRTVSRWETGSNMPDISILIQIADFYKIDIKEILDGERKSENMTNEMKETLNKVADYTKEDKNRVSKAGKIAFCIMYFVCAAAIIVQLILSGQFPFVYGETAVLLAGGITYLVMIIRFGLWEADSRKKRTATNDAILSFFISV